MAMLQLPQGKHTLTFCLRALDDARPRLVQVVVGDAAEEAQNMLRTIANWQKFSKQKNFMLLKRHN